jgi:hypothetical protein
MATILNDSIRRRIIDAATRFSTGSFATPSPVAGVRVLYTETPHPRTPVLYEPSIVIVAQGAKIGHVGDRTFRYDADNYLLLTVPLPFECQTIASREEPFVGVSIDIDTAMLQELLIDLEDEDFDRPGSLECPGVNSARFTEEVLCALERLVDAMDHPRDAKVLGRLIVKEIVYHVLCGESGAAGAGPSAYPLRAGDQGPAAHRVELRQALERRAAGQAGEHERVGLPSQLQGRHQHLAAAVCEELQAAQGATDHAERRREGRRCRHARGV